MLATPYQGNPDTMTTRSATLVTIGLLAILLAVVALATLFAGDISERTGGLVSSVLGSFATVLAGLLLFLRVETVNVKADQAASKATEAATKAATVEKKVEAVHHDILNGGLRDNVKRAISESERDPAIQEQRIDNAAKGVSRDRHAKAQRDTVEQGWSQIEARLAARRRREQEGEDRQT